MKRRNQAQGMVEFALAIPVLLLIVWGIIEVAHLLYVYNAVVVGARAASRYSAGEGTVTGLNHWQDCQSIRNAAKNITPLVGLQDSDILISIIHKDVATQAWVTTPICPTNSPDRTSVPVVNLGDRVMVSVTANYSPLVPLVIFQPMRLSSVSTHTLLIQVPIGN
jgi:Flp pilus assembly protein TadG